MKKLFIFALASLLTLSACGKKADENKADEAKAEVAADAKADEKDPLVGLDKKGWDEMVGKMKSTERKQLEAKALKHADPNVRKLPLINYTHNLEKGYGDEIMAEPLLHVLQNETDLEVLELALKSNMNNLSYSKDFFEAYKKYINHENVDIRKAAMEGFINSNNLKANVEGLEDVAIKFLDDPDSSVKSKACYYLAYYKYPSVKPKIAEFIKSASDEEMLAECVKGLTETWYNSFGDFDEEAYKMTMDYLKKTPRTRVTPSYIVIERLANSPRDSWVDVAKDKFDAKSLVAVLSDIAKDGNASEGARTSAIEAIAIHGTKADLTALNKAITEEGVVKREIATQMEKAK